MQNDLDRLYREHRKGLFTLALAITRDAGQAEDAVHEAFTRLCRRTYHPNGDAASYIYAAVRNAARDQIRQRRCGASSTQRSSIFKESIALADPDAAPDRATLEAERDRMLRQAIEQLAEDQREVVVMKLFGNLTFEQIAKAIGSPLSTINSRYRRALEELEKALEDKI